MAAKIDTGALARALGKLPGQITRNVASGAARAFAAPIVEDAKRRCHSQEVADSLGVTSKVDGTGVTATIATRGPGAFKAPWLENGTDPHLIAVEETDRAGRSIGRINRLVREGSLVIGGNFVGPKVEHPGARPFPFLRPAIDTQVEAGIAAAAAYLAKRFATGDLDTPAPADEDPA